MDLSEDKESPGPGEHPLRDAGRVFPEKNCENTGALIFPEMDGSLELLKESEERYRLLFETSRDAIMILEPPEWKFTSANASTLDMFRAENESVFLATAPWMVSPEFQPDNEPSVLKANKMIEAAMHDGSHLFEWTHKRLNGETFPATVLLTHINLRGKDLLQATVRDITEQKKLEEQLMHAQKLEGIGQLAGGIAHDFNNILNAVVGFAGLIQMKMESSNPLSRYVEEIMAAGLRGASLTRQILDFSRKQMIEMKPVDLNEIIRSVQKMLLRLIREDIEIRYDLAPEELVIFTDAGQIDQIMINLVTNASDAMRTNGRIVISARRFVMTPGHVEALGFGSPGKFAILTVSDSGMGMDESTIAHIFEPFFTTKDPGKGTGLGLSVVHGIVRQLNGFIDVSSVTGKGTNVMIYLPLVSDNVGVFEYGPEVRERGGSETVLIAEDDTALRKLLAALLDYYGYTVIEAADGEEAVKKFSENADDIKLVILDGIMPKKNGNEAFDEMRSLRREIRAIFLSGYAEDEFCHHAISERTCVFIRKPVTPSNLLKQVREVLDR